MKCLYTLGAQGISACCAVADAIFFATARHKRVEKPAVPQQVPLGGMLRGAGLFSGPAPSRVAATDATVAVWGMCCGSLTICTRLWRGVVMKRDTRNSATGSFSMFYLFKVKNKKTPTTDHELSIYVEGSRPIYLLRCCGAAFHHHCTPQAGGKRQLPATGHFGRGCCVVAQGRVFFCTCP